MIRSSRPPRLVRARRLAVALAALLVLGSAHGTASADHGGRDIGSFMACDRPVSPPRCTSVGNNVYHFVAFDESLSDGLAAALRASMAEDFDEPTVLTLFEQARVNSATDVIAFSGDYGDNGAAGWVYCPTDAPQGINQMGHRWCRHQEMHLNVNPRYGLFFDDEASRGHIVCHELGHTLGLRHWGNPPQTDGPVGATCMRANTPNGPTSLHQADIDHINAYPYGWLPPPRGLRILRSPEAPAIFAGVPAGPLEALQADEADSLAELIGSADAVVHGQIETVDPGRVFGPSSRPLHYAAVTVGVLGWIAGEPPGSHAATLTLEIPLFDGPDSIDRLRSGLVGSERVLFLRDKGESARRAGMSANEQAADAGFYRLVTFAAEIANVDGRALGPSDESGVLAPFAGRPFSEALAEVRASAP